MRTIFFLVFFAVVFYLVIDGFTSRPIEDCSVSLSQKNITATGVFTILNSSSILHHKIVDSISIKLTTGCRTLNHPFPQREITSWKNYKFPLTVSLYWKGEEVMSESDVFISGCSLSSGFNQIHLYVDHSDFGFQIYEFEGDGLRPTQDYLARLSGLERED